jgi:hypothetical protein
MKTSTNDRDIDNTINNHLVIRNVLSVMAPAYPVINQNNRSARALGRMKVTLQSIELFWRMALVILFRIRAIAFPVFA